MFRPAGQEPGCDPVAPGMQPTHAPVDISHTVAVTPGHPPPSPAQDAWQLCVVGEQTGVPPEQSVLARHATQVLFAVSQCERPITVQFASLTQQVGPGVGQAAAVEVLEVVVVDVVPVPVGVIVTVVVPVPPSASVKVEIDVLTVSVLPTDVVTELPAFVVLPLPLAAASGLPPEVVLPHPTSIVGNASAPAAIASAAAATDRVQVLVIVFMAAT